MKAAIPLACLCLLLCACAQGNAVKMCQPLAERFLECMAKSQFEDAHALCRADNLSLDDLKAWAADPGNKSMLKDYKGVEWGDGGQYTEKNPDFFDQPTFRTPQVNTLTGRPDVNVQFMFRREDTRWFIASFAMKSGK